MLRYGLGLLVLLCATGCKQDIVCCNGDGLDGAVLTTREECDAYALSVVPDGICEGITDPDLDLSDNVDTDEPVDEPLETDSDEPEDTDVEDTDDTDVSAGITCAEFCTVVLGLCPSDSACEDSCGHSLCPVTPAVMACLDEATACNETGVCWNMFLDTEEPAECDP